MVDWKRLGTAVYTAGGSELARAAGFDPFADPGTDEERRRKLALQRQSQLASAFAGQGQRGYTALGERGNGALDYLQGQAEGRNSVTAEQLRQGLQQNLAAQQSIAAGASPQNAAMAARTAAIQSARLGSGMAGQQALAGLQERNQAQQQYAGLLQGLRGQDLQATLGSRGQAIQGYSPQSAGTPEQSWFQKYGPTLMSGAQLAATASDRRLKTDIRDGDAAANKAMSKLGAHLYRYKDEKWGKGEQLSPMAQDMERAGLGHAVIDTPAGKMVHGAKAATAGLALAAALSRRVDKLESKR